MKSDYIAGSENINTVVRGCRVPYNVETSQAPRLQPLSRLLAPEVTPAIRQLLSHFNTHLLKRRSVPTF